MIIVFTGTVGGGKTLSMTVEAYKYYRQGHAIYSNYWLNFPHTLLTAKRFREMIEEKEQLQNVVLLLDEAHIWIDSRGSMTKKNKMISYFILQTRKRNVRLLATTQHYHQLDKRLRDTADIVCFCQNVSNKTSLVDVGKKVLIHQQYYYVWDPMKPNRQRVLYANPYFSLFDTREIVDFTEE